MKQLFIRMEVAVRKKSRERPKCALSGFVLDKKMTDCPAYTTATIILWGEKRSQ